MLSVLLPVQRKLFVYELRVQKQEVLQPPLFTSSTDFPLSHPATHNHILISNIRLVSGVETNISNVKYELANVPRCIRLICHFEAGI